ncbi:MAG: PHP domain-containing protein [Oligosphaeraceae bacterium]|nr:PHP domain-containing protein [Oligosphaeraceae bacterium]
MMLPKSDFHIHTHCSCDSASAQIQDIVREYRAHGFKQLGISDHLHTRFNLPDIVIARQEYDALGCDADPDLHFGIEVTCATAWECEKIARRDYTSCFTIDVEGIPFRTITPIDGVMFGGPTGGPLQIDLTDEEIRMLKIEYVIGGVHKPNYTRLAPEPMLEDFFNQMCYLIKHPIIDILAHPWDGLAFWSSKTLLTKDRSEMRFDVYRMIPQEMNDELGRLLIENRKYAEINASIIDVQGMPDDAIHAILAIYARWKEQGVTFTYGSDLHEPHYPKDRLKRFDVLIREYGFKEEDFVQPKFRKY